MLSSNLNTHIIKPRIRSFDRAIKSVNKHSGGRVSKHFLVRLSSPTPVSSFTPSDELIWRRWTMLWRRNSHTCSHDRICGRPRTQKPTLNHRNQAQKDSGAQQEFLSLFIFVCFSLSHPHCLRKPWAENATYTLDKNKQSLLLSRRDTRKHKSSVITARALEITLLNRRWLASSTLASM